MANETSGLDSVGEMPGVGGLGMGFEGGGAARPAVPPAGDRPAGAPTSEESSLITSLLYSSGNLGSGVFWALNNFILPIFLGALHMPVILIGLLSGTRSFEG
ncbi:MAG: hypothetical protein ACXVCX_19100, partial [Ktedonobacterales bacterium]